MTTIAEVLKDRAEHGMSEILFEIYCCAYCNGAGMSCTTLHSDAMRQLIWLLADRHRTEVLLPRGYDPGPVLADELPGWLLSLSRQADTIAPLENAEGAPE
jgi:hypothetical protein